MFQVHIASAHGSGLNSLYCCGSCCGVHNFKRGTHLGRFVQVIPDQDDSRSMLFLHQCFRDIKECLEEIKMSEAKTLSVEDGVHLNVLIGKFSNPWPIMPLNLFNLNLRTAASLAGLALTYMLVLLKFRFGDTAKNDQVNLMSNSTVQYLINALKNNNVSVVEL